MLQGVSTIIYIRPMWPGTPLYVTGSRITNQSTQISDVEILVPCYSPHFTLYYGEV